MFTVCSKCNLRLVVTAADLRAAQGYVRCGRCHNVFNALAALSDELSEPGVSPAPAPAPAPAGAQAPGAHTAPGTRTTPAAADMSAAPTAPAPAAVADTPDMSATPTAPAPAAVADTSAAPAPAAVADTLFAAAESPENPFEFNAARTDLDDVFVEAQPDIDATGTFESIVLVGEEDSAAQAATLSGMHTAPDPDPQWDPYPDPDPKPATEVSALPGPVPPATLPGQAPPAAQTQEEALVATGNSEALSALDMPEALGAQLSGETSAGFDAPPSPDAGDLPEAPDSTLWLDAPINADALQWLNAPAHPQAAHTPQAATGPDAAPRPDGAEPSSSAPSSSGPSSAEPPGCEPRGSDHHGARVASAVLDAARALQAAAEPAPADLLAGPAAAAPRRRGLEYAAAALLLVLLAQVAHHYRSALATLEPLQQPLTALYAALGVPLHPRWDISRYEVHQLGAVAGAQNPGDLVVRASLSNTAARAQPLPLLRVIVQDRFGNRVAARDVLPAQYLPHSRAAATMMRPGERLDAKVAFVDPGPTVVGFEIDACLVQRTGKTVCANDPGGH